MILCTVGGNYFVSILYTHKSMKILCYINEYVAQNSMNHLMLVAFVSSKVARRWNCFKAPIKYLYIQIICTQTPHMETYHTHGWGWSARVQL